MDKEKIRIEMRRDVFESPVFQKQFTELVAKITDDFDIICLKCNHRKSEHKIGKGGRSYCLIGDCYCPRFSSKKL